MLTAMLFSLHAYAETPTDLPQPDTRRPARTKELRAIRTGAEPFPEALVPWNYARRGKLTRGLYYDEQGRVFSRAQVTWLLADAVQAGCGPCQEPYRKHRRQTVAASISGALMMLAPITLPITAPIAIGNAIPADRNFGLTVDAFNGWKATGNTDAS